MTAVPQTSTIRDQVSAEEWQARIDLAAAYRLVALYGWDDLIFTHISPEAEGDKEDASLVPYYFAQQRAGRHKQTYIAGSHGYRNPTAAHERRLLTHGYTRQVSSHVLTRGMSPFLDS